MKIAAMLILLVALGCAKKPAPPPNPNFGNDIIALPPTPPLTPASPNNLPVSPPDFVASCRYAQVHCDIQMERQIEELQERLSRLEKRYELSRP